MITNYKASKTDSFSWIISEMFYDTPCEKSRLNPGHWHWPWLGCESHISDEGNTYHYSSTFKWLVNFDYLDKWMELKSFSVGSETLG